MAVLDYDERMCEKFCGKPSQNTAGEHAPTIWKIVAYGCILTDDPRFQTVLSKLHAHAADQLRYKRSHPVPYNQKLIDTLRLQPGAYLPGASLADVCTHFRQHYACIIDPERMDDPEYQEVLESYSYKCGPKYGWCLVVDDASLQSIESAPPPVGPTPPEGAKSWELAYNAKSAFLTLLSSDHTTMEKPELLYAQSRNGGGRRTEWNGWLKFSIIDLMRVFEEADSGDDIKTYIRDQDKVVNFM
ncbi:hypothetical protein BKA63DRAFT_574078 [Paraphoma chrysanthemicola]|nr:hypothetical protein BKA63DRAFT_574078 [Paraphoma chrysanthemicola]